jgi:hypothetical protein
MSVAFSTSKTLQTPGRNAIIQWFSIKDGTDQMKPQLLQSTAAIAQALVQPLAEEIAKKLRIQLLAGDDCLLTPSEAQEFLRRGSSTLEFWRSVGIGPRFVRLGPRSIAYRLGDLRVYVAEAARGPARLTDIEIADRNGSGPTA